MSGSKDADTSSNSSTNNTSVTTYGNTTTSNPFFKSTTNNNGTTTNFNNSGIQGVYDYINNNAVNWLNDIKNPNLNSAQNQAKIDMFNRELNKQTTQQLQNDILAPLFQKNMIRSSVADDMYTNLANKNQESYDNYINSLLADSNNSALNQYNALINTYNGLYNMLTSNQQQSLQTSSGNATTKTNGKTNTNSSSSV